jgi:hypothetical protein
MLSGDTHNDETTIARAHSQNSKQAKRFTGAVLGVNKVVGFEQFAIARRTNVIHRAWF